MLKIFLVEDEIVVRESIKKKVNWEAHGFEFVGEASDGEMAYSLIQNVSPDVVITDIKMPFMDGLELSRLLKKEMPWIKIILLTGHSEFEYAQEAIRIGATDYILKPISSAGLEKVLDELREKLEEEREQQVFLQQYEREMEERREMEQQLFYESLLTGRDALADLLERANQMGMSIAAEAYAILLFCFTEKEKEEWLYSEKRTEIETKIEQDICKSEYGMLYKRSLDGYVFIAKAGSEVGIAEQMERIVHDLQAHFDSMSEIEYFIAIGPKVQRISDLPKCFQKTIQAFSNRFVMEKNQVIRYDPFYTHVIPQRCEPDLLTFEVEKLNNKIVEQFLRKGDGKHTPYMIEQLFDMVGEELIDSLMLRQYFVMNIYVMATSFLKELNISTEEVTSHYGSIDNIPQRLATTHTAKTFLIDLVTRTIRIRDEHSHKRYNQMLTRAKEYIRENYADDHISLNRVAREVNISATHFSSIFSQETGSTFIEYLTEVRLEKAKELLRCTDKKTSEIAYAVGYKDPRYFSHLFKKITGDTPRQFRTQ